MSTKLCFERVLPALILILGMALLSSTRSAFCQQTVNPPAPNSVSSGNNQFAFDLFHHIASGEKNANVFFSPVSISTALAMAYAGSQGETRKQMAQVLHFAGSQQEVAGGFHSLMQSLRAPANHAYQLSVANALWAQKDTRFTAEFTSLMSTYFAGEFNTVNFADSEQSLATINHWVAEKTAGKIPQLLQPGDIMALTRLVLTNAVYFKGDWTTPFLETATKPEAFTCGDGANQQVPMMHRTGQFNYAQAGELQVLELPYKGNQLSMIVLLPRAGATAQWPEFTAEKLQQLRAQMKSTRVDLSLPRFKVEARLSLARTLSAMGMPEAFTAREADFSGITGKNDWYISAVIHDAVIDVNEKGTEAAAATGAVMSFAAMMPQKPVIFRADHPFVYLIVHKPSGAILFLGRLSNPPASGQ